MCSLGLGLEFCILVLGKNVLWGPIICGPGPFLHWGPRPKPRKGNKSPNRLETQPRVILSSAYPRSPWKEGQKRYRNSLGKNLKISRSIDKGTLDSITTKDKGKAALTAIQYSAPVRAILFSFYNHPQPLWVWADGTSISSRKSNPHVDVG